MSKNKKNLGREMDIISFAESENGLGIPLLPVQKFILKMFYGLPLEGLEKTITLPTEDNSAVIGSFTEKEFLQYLIDTGRTNVVSYSEDYSPTELVLNAGRRSTKSVIEGIICGYELYKLKSKHNPQRYYGMPDDGEISVCVVSCTVEQAGVFRDLMMKDYIPQSWRRNGAVKPTRANSFSIEGDGGTTIRVVSGGCNGNSIYGNSSILVVMDEMAFFRDDRKVYERLIPSITSFTPKDEGTHPTGSCEGRVVMVSTPFGKKGKFYEKYIESFSEPDMILMFDMYSTMLNPTIDGGFLKNEKNWNPQAFSSEFEAVFTD